jgi:hypothetical protein
MPSNLLHTRRAATALALAIAPALAGCYSYSTVAPGTGRAGTEVQVEVSDQGTADLAQTLGPRVQTIDGTLGGYTDTTLTVMATRLTRFGGVEQSLSGDTLVLPRRAVGRVLSRQFSRTRSVLVGGGVLAGLIALGFVLGDSEDVGGRPPGGGMPTPR